MGRGGADVLGGGPRRFSLQGPLDGGQEVGGRSLAGVRSMPGSGLVKHVVIFVKEDHTFVDYFGTFPFGARSVRPGAFPERRASAPAAWPGPAQSGRRVL